MFTSNEKKVERRAVKFEPKRNVNLRRDLQQVGGTSPSPLGWKKIFVWRDMG